MSQSSFIKAFDVTVYHTFFDNSKCNCLHFIPDNNTEKAFKKFGLRMNRISNGFELFLNSTSTIADKLDYISKTTSLDYFEFNINSSNPFFTLFTALPINFSGQISYTSQDNKNQADNGVVILNETLETNKINPFLGLLRIYFEDIKKSQENGLHFQIRFNARATQWQYYIINKNAVVLDNPVVTEKGQIQFDGPKDVVLETGEKALLFTSNETDLPLSEKPKYKFDLINKNTSANSDQKSTNGKVLLKGLPVPDVSRIGIIQNKESIKVTSPMYVYL